MKSTLKSRQLDRREVQEPRDLRKRSSYPRNAGYYLAIASSAWFRAALIDFPSVPGGCNHQEKTYTVED